MRFLRWFWPIALVGVLIVGPWACYVVRPETPVRVVVVDKTVPFPTRLEHRSLFWLLNHLKIVHPDRGSYDPARDYVGAFPGPEPGDRPQRTIDLTPEAALTADVVYLVDTYGVYEGDLESGPAMKAALERSPKIYGGLTVDEARAAHETLAAGATVIAEFNSMGSPTGSRARVLLESVTGVRSTRWNGRLFHRLEDRDEVPEWLRRVWELEWNDGWEFRGPGYVLVKDDTFCEVFRLGVQTENRGLTIERERPIDHLLSSAADGTTYPYWFEVVETDADVRVLAYFRWNVTPGGRERLRSRGLPERFPAVVRRLEPGGGTAYYFAGDFADNPMPDHGVPLAGYLTLRRWIEGVKLAPSETEFYWRFYVPMMTRLLDEAAPE